MPTRFHAVLLLMVLLSGCDTYEAVTTDSADKVNRAYPLREDVAAGRASLLAALENDKSARQAAGEQLTQLLQMRALSCMAGAPIGRFDTVADVRRKIGADTCFREQDSRIADWVGIRRVGVAMAQPALVAPAALPARFALPGNDSPVDLLVAPAANVAAVQSARSRYTIVELPSGKTLSQVDAPGTGTHLSSFSSNGRVLALSSGQAIKFHDANTGQLLWGTDKYMQVVAWLEEAGATLLSEKGAPALLDHVKATAQAAPIALPNVTWSTRMPGSQRILVGGGTGVALLQYGRSADGALAVEPVQQWRLNGQGVTSGRPILMAGGTKLFFTTTRDLGWLDIPSGGQGSWGTQAILASGFSKLSETQLYLDANTGTAPNWQRQPYILDIGKATLAPAAREPQEGLLLALTPRTGYARRAHSSGIAVATTADASDEERPVDKVLAEMALNRELAKIQPSDIGIRMPGIGTMVPPGLVPAPALPSRPMLSIPADARVTVVGVYEAASGMQGQRQPRRAGSVRVTVAPGKTPLVLVLSSYESVNWIVQDNGRPIRAILLSGYQPSQVLGTQAEVYRIGSAYAYKQGTVEYERLKQDIARYVGAPVQAFQGAYSGLEFSVY